MDFAVVLCLCRRLVVVLRGTPQGTVNNISDEVDYVSCYVTGRGWGVSIAFKVRSLSSRKWASLHPLGDYHLAFLATTNETWYVVHLAG